MPPLDDAWHEVDLVRQQISIEVNDLLRVSRVAGEYARMFLAAEYLYWFGAAAFAANEVRRNMSLRRVRWFGLSSMLSHGNIAVFNDVYPALACYRSVRPSVMNHQVSITDVVDSMTKRNNPDVATEICTAVKQIHAGENEKGAKAILYFEQSVTLQREL